MDRYAFARTDSTLIRCHTCVNPATDPKQGMSSPTLVFYNARQVTNTRHGFSTCPGSHYQMIDPGVSAMNESRYKSAITQAYEGECYGMHLFGLLAGRRQDNEMHRRIWTLIQSVERVTEQRLRPIAVRLDIDLATHRTQGVQRANNQATVFSELSAGEIAHWYMPRLKGFLTELQAMAELAPDEESQAMQQLVEHSRVFGQCIRAITQGQPEQGVSALEGFLKAGSDHHDCSPHLSSLRGA